MLFFFFTYWNVVILHLLCIFEFCVNVNKISFTAYVCFICCNIICRNRFKNISNSAECL